MLTVLIARVPRAVRRRKLRATNELPEKRLDRQRPAGKPGGAVSSSTASSVRRLAPSVPSAASNWLSTSRRFDRPRFASACRGSP